MSELIQLSFDKIMQTRAYTVVILKGDDKRFAIYTDPGIGKIFQNFLTKTENPRPLTHEIVHKIFEGVEIKIKQVIITDVQDTIYFARLFLEQYLGGIHHIIEADMRPSDSLIWALMAGAPIYCTREMLAKTIPVEDE